MTTLTSHALKPSKLSGLPAATRHVETILRPYRSLLRSTPLPEAIEEALAKALESVDTLRREVEDAIADSRMTTEIRSDIATGLSHDGICLSQFDRVKLAEREGLALAFSYTPGVDSAPHPVGVGSCDVAIHAGNSTSLDGRVG